VREDGAIPALSTRKSTNELHDLLPKINWQSENGAQLDHDRVHLPEAIMQIDVEKRFANAQMRRRAHRKELCQSFNDSKKDGKQVVVHSLDG
jgi:hypothetical protein